MRASWISTSPSNGFKVCRKPTLCLQAKWGLEYKSSMMRKVLISSPLAYISEFGGNASAVTIFGESAGGVSTEISFKKERRFFSVQTQYMSMAFEFY